jgi:electron transfer flavoprotein alpha subunit
MTKVLVLGEHKDGKLKLTASELCNAAAKDGAEIIGVVFGDAPEGPAKELGTLGAKKVFAVKTSGPFQPDVVAATTAKLVAQEKVDVILGAASSSGKDVFPRIAGRLNVGLATDCIAVTPSKKSGRRPVYAGKAFLDFTVTSTPAMFTVRPNVLEPGKPGGGNAEVVPFAAVTDSIRAQTKEVVAGKSNKPDLTEAKTIVSGGRAMKNADNFKILHELADVIGATVGASRAAVDSGYASHDMQVGQTGKVVNPNLYIACGISGAIQHLAGMKTSKVIVAINKDPEAPIFQKADYGIVGDLFEVVPKLTEEFKKLLAR